MSDKYKYVEKFLDDIQLIFDNCKNYNIESNLIFDTAQVVEKHFHDLIQANLNELEVQCQPQLNIQQYQKIKIEIDQPLQFYEKNRFAVNTRYLTVPQRDLVLNSIVRFSQKSVTCNEEGFVVDFDIIKPKVFRKISALVEKQVFQPHEQIITPQSLDFSSRNKEKASVNNQTQLNQQNSYVNNQNQNLVQQISVEQQIQKDLTSNQDISDIIQFQ